MSNFRINFEHPWFLLLLLPAVALTLLPYFKLSKRYRKTRNRVCSMVLHVIVMVLAITMLAGITFSYELPNKQNELIVLIDSSYSNRYSEEEKEDFIEDVVKECDASFKVGIVKFGYDQVYAAPLTNDSSKAFAQYRASAEPDTSATDVASALQYAASLFNHQKTAKIVLISDGIETDGEAMSVVSRIAAQGIKIDTVYYPNSEKPEIQISSVVTPDRNVDTGEEFAVQVNLKGNLGGGSTETSLTLYDNEEEIKTETFSAVEGEQSISFTHKFELPGLHELRFVLTNEEDTDSHNNEYISYIYLREYKNVLLLEQSDGEGAVLKSVLEENSFRVTDYSFSTDLGDIPTDLATLAKYEEVLLVNVANEDLKKIEGFDVLLNEYVQTLGGGLFTVGGANDTNAAGESVPHAYNREDMEGSLFQQMLPVQVIPYTPPVAVVILVDSSGSMGQGSGSLLDIALEGTKVCVNSLNSSDYCGVMTFSDNANQEVKITPVSEKEKILDAVLDIGDSGSGGTVFRKSLEAAGRALKTVNVARKHIILVTDGQPSDDGDVEDPDSYRYQVNENRKAGITMSIVKVGKDEVDEKLKEVAEQLGGGKFCYGSDSESIIQSMYEDLVTVIPEVDFEEEISLKFGDVSSITAGITNESELPKITGYYGTRLKSDAVQPLKGEYVPIYAQWKYGNGMVGSFMSDVTGVWSDGGAFAEDPVGQTIICNIVKALFPAKEIPSQDITVKTNEDNYTSEVGVYYREDLSSEETVEMIVTPVSKDAKNYYRDNEISVISSNGYTSFEFDVTCPGIYLVTINRKNVAGDVTASTSFYKCLAYSQEYNVFLENELTGEEYMQKIADTGRGILAEKAEDVFESFERTIQRVHDPRVWYAILIIVLFLVDIAVRKFKFRWLHEIFRDRALEKETR